MSKPALLNVAIIAANIGAAELEFAVKKVHKLNVMKKGPTDYVTEVDRRVEEIVFEKIKEYYPDDNFLGEESGHEVNTSETTWILDPIDGTTNFIHGIPQFAVSIGLCKNKVPILGVVYDPFKNELFCAEKGKGALMNDKKIRVANCSSLKSAVLGTGIPYRKKDHSGVYIETLRTLMDARCGSIRRLGAAALDLAYVASGRLDGFWEFNLKPWDIAAGSIIVSEAGGHISDIKNTGGYFDSGNVLAANLSLHQSIINELQENLL